MGLPSIGYDPHPIFYRIAAAKVVPTDELTQIPAIYDIISKGVSSPASLDILKPKQREYLEKLFDLNVLASFLGAREELKRHHFGQSNLAFLILSRMIDHGSKAQTDGIYKAPDSRKKGLSPKDALNRVFRLIQEDLPFYKNGQCAIYNSSSERMSEVGDAVISSIITSPPYLNNLPEDDYAEMTRMYLYFWDMAESWGDITTKVRSKLLVNTTTSLKGHKDKQNIYRASIPNGVLVELDSLVSQLTQERMVRAGKKEYDFLVYPYFAQMIQIISECHRVLKSTGRFHMMVADAALYGVHIATPQLLADLLKIAGFQNVCCNLVRKRGHRWILDKRDGSKRGLGEYYISAEKSE